MNCTHIHAYTQTPHTTHFVRNCWMTDLIGKQYCWPMHIYEYLAAFGILSGRNSLAQDHPLPPLLQWFEDTTVTPTCFARMRLWRLLCSSPPSLFLLFSSWHFAWAPSEPRLRRRCDAVGVGRKTWMFQKPVGGDGRWKTKKERKNIFELPSKSRLEYRKTREFQTQLLQYFSKSDNKSNHHRVWQNVKFRPWTYLEKWVWESGPKIDPATGVDSATGVTGLFLRKKYTHINLVRIT